MKPLISILLFALAVHITGAQEHAEFKLQASFSDWEVVLEAGTLERWPDIVPVDGGFAVAADSFEDPSWYFDSEWVRYNPETGRWSTYEFPPEPSSLVDIDHKSIARLDIAGLFPDEPDLNFQLVDGGKKVVFLRHVGEMLFDHHVDKVVVIVNPADNTVERLNLWMCHGPQYSEDIVWDFPEDNLSVSCDLLIWHEGDSHHTQTMSDYIGKGRGPSMLHLLSTSPDNRFWILRERFYGDPWFGDHFLYDRQTGLTTVLLWQDRAIPFDFIVWLNNSAVIVNEGDYVLYFDAKSHERRELLVDELLELSEAPSSLLRPRLSVDGQWLLVATKEGELLLRNVFDALGRQH